MPVKTFQTKEPGDTAPTKEFKRVPIYADRKKMIEALDNVDRAVEAGSLSPSDLPELEEKILEATNAIHYYEGIAVPESLSESKPHFRAWMKLKYGDHAESEYKAMDSDDLDYEYDNLMVWLEEVSPNSKDFKEYLRLWKDEVKKDITWAQTQYGDHD